MCVVDLTLMSAYTRACFFQDAATAKAQASTIAFEALKAQSNADRFEYDVVSVVPFCVMRVV